MKDQFYENQKCIDEKFINTLQSRDNRIVKDFLERCKFPPSELVSLVLKQQQESLIDMLTALIPERFFQTKNSQWVEPWVQLNKYLADFRNDIQGAYNVVEHILNNISKKRDKNNLSEGVLEAMIYFKKMTSLYNQEYHPHPQIKSILEAPFRGLYYFLFYDASEIEFRYILKCLRDQIKARSMPQGVKLEKLCLMTLTDEEIKHIKYKILRARTIIETGNAEYFLKDENVREECMEKIKKGDHNMSLCLGIYYYDTQDYDKSFHLLIKTRRCSVRDRANICLGRMYLGLMYYYGRGVERDYEKAKLLLEEVLEADALGADYIEAYYVLGQIYELTESLEKAVEIYTSAMEQYENVENPFKDEIYKRYIDICCCSTRPDELKFIVNISLENLECEFSLELPFWSKFIINWGDNNPKGKHEKLTIDTSKKKITTLRHKYKTPGKYEISVSTLPGRSLYGFEFKKYEQQLQSIKFIGCYGIKKIAITGQSLKKLILPDSRFLIGLICRNNNITRLDLRKHSKLQYLDCSYNPIKEIQISPYCALFKVCVKNTLFDKICIDKILDLNGGNFTEPLNFKDIIELNMPLEHYFRLTDWKKIKQYMEKEESFDCYRKNLKLKELKTVFECIKELSNKRNETPYDKGYLDIYCTFVNDKTIIGIEEFFIWEKEWTVCLATKVHCARFQEAWMGKGAPSPEYFVANCLINMINNKSEMNKYIYKAKR